MPHTKQQLQVLLASAGIRPRHRWGQNFLIDLNLMRLLVDTAELQNKDLVVEVGCGTGSLTSLLAERAGHVVTVDIDPILSGIAREELKPHHNITFILGDALATKSQLNPEILQAVADLRPTFSGRLLLVANLPYDIAAPLIINLLLSNPPWQPDHMMITVQLEVAQRMVAAAGTRDYGMLSVLLQATGKVALVRKINPQSFWPPPRVHSAIVAWHRIPEKCHALGSLRAFKVVVDVLLGHRRKKISSCLKEAGLGACLESLAAAGLDLDARGETLAPEQMIQFAKLIGTFSPKP